MIKFRKNELLHAGLHFIILIKKLDSQKYNNFNC